MKCDSRVTVWKGGTCQPTIECRGSGSRLLMPGNSLRHNFFANDDAAGIGVVEFKLQFHPVNLRPESGAIGANELTDDPQIAADRLTSQCDLLVQDFASA